MGRECCLKKRSDVGEGSVVGRRVLRGGECCGEESVRLTCPRPLVALTLAPTPRSVDTQSVFPSWKSGRDSVASVRCVSVWTV